MQIMTCSDIVSSGPSMKHFLKGDPNKDWRSKVTIIGHRGVGKNDVTSALTEGVELRPSIMENTVVSFNTAARSGADFVEFDVQVTKDGCPVIFHDDFIVVNDKETNCLSHRRVGDLTLEEFQQIGYQKDSKKIDKVLYRKTCDGSYSQWIMSVDDGLCTLRDAFEQVLPSVGFNIELKFDDYNVLSHQELKFSIDAILKVVKECCLGRKIFFTSFHPDAAVMLRRHESNHPVLFLTDGVPNVYPDARRGSVAAAIEVCLMGNLQGIVVEVNSILQQEDTVQRVKNAGLALLTYGELNNLGHVLHLQASLGVDGIIVDHVLEMVIESLKGNAFGALSACLE